MTKIEGLKESDLTFDKDNLDREWVRHPKLVRIVSDALADAKKRLEYLKGRMEVEEAELRLKVGKKPVWYGCTEKGTVAEVNSAVTVQLDKAGWPAKLRKAKYNLDIIQGFYNAIEAKRRAMEAEVQLYVHNYYSQPREPEGAQDAIHSLQERGIAKRGIDPPKKKRNKRD